MPLAQLPQLEAIFSGFAAQVRDPKDWNQVRDGVEAKRCDSPEGSERFVLVRSTDRQAKEQAMHERFATRIEDGLTKLGRRIHTARKRLARGPIERKLAVFWARIRV